MLLHPANLFHIGVVAADIESTMQEMSETMDLRWQGGRPAKMNLHLYGEERSVEMRIAHSVEGPPHYELIEAVPDTPWVLPPGEIFCLHHICYWSDTAVSTCADLEASGLERIMGKPGSDGGYFRARNGRIVEILERTRYEGLRDWITGASKTRRDDQETNHAEMENR